VILRGIRFAPSPTGTFHVGNLRTAWISAMIAKELGEPWVIRVEDIDTARIRPDSWPSQQSDLKALGLTPDSHHLHLQTQNRDRHFELFRKARDEQRIYPCDCSRQEVLAQIAGLASAPHSHEAAYSGHCRHRGGELSSYHPKETLAWRWKHTDPTGAHDAIVARSANDGSQFNPGYHWACAIDDADGAYLVLVRAWDLASADPIQREIRNWVAPVPIEPVVFHTSLVTRDDGQRLEKRTLGVTLEEIVARGISPAALIERFESSFNLAATFEIISNCISPAGENRKSVTLSQLSL
jgi:glutamyl/glutaminyl-tRNA synthetase